MVQTRSVHVMKPTWNTSAVHMSQYVSMQTAVVITKVEPGAGQQYAENEAHNTAVHVAKCVFYGG